MGGERALGHGFKSVVAEALKVSQAVWFLSRVSPEEMRKRAACLKGGEAGGWGWGRTRSLCPDTLPPHWDQPTELRAGCRWSHLSSPPPRTMSPTSQPHFWALRLAACLPPCAHPSRLTAESGLTEPP